MIANEFFYNKLISHNVGFFCGVPDSLLKDFCAYITDNVDEKNHIIAVNEGAAIGLATGYHIASGFVPLVYMQNSGIGNAVNPLLSLTDPEVYGIPIVLLIGWRGQPGIHDEPQHIKQGKVTCELLSAMNIPYTIMDSDENKLQNQLEECFATIKKRNCAYAFVVQKNTFAPYILKKIQPDISGAAMTREAAIEIIAHNSDGIIVSTTGMASRELYEIREKNKSGHERDFLTVGSMGHASSIAMEIALQKSNLAVTCLDGDGALLMHLGAVATIGVKTPQNLCHIVLNNGAHDSVGAQATIADRIDLCAIAKASGYSNVYLVKTENELKRIVQKKHNALTFIEVRVKKGARKDLGRPSSTPLENKNSLSAYINPN
ncbi:MAG: phosphonopyruvate decarboxylase [Termitinemataceae bacterium]|nr:MAG: phosphonopyruvate decarboxylase [Termitinemataceae bacterium]